MRRTVKALVVAGIVLVATSACVADGPITLSGTVVDVDGAPVSGCNILPSSLSFNNPEMGIRSGPDGRFTWPSIPPGIYTVTAECRTASGEISRQGVSGLVTITGDVDVTVSVQ